MIEKHFVRFYSPGTFCSETTEKEIDSWDVEEAVKLSREIKERHSATPYGFCFFTKSRSDQELDSKIISTSNMYYLGGTVYTLQDILDRNDPNDKILISNMKMNRYDRVIENTNSWKITQLLNKDDVVLEY